MSVAAVAVAGTVVAAGVGYAGQRQSAKAQRRAADQQAQAMHEQLEWEKQQYADWEKVYGPIQNNLSNFYSNLSPDYYAAVGIENFNKQFQASMQRIETSLAQRGIDPASGIQASLTQQAELSAAETRATLRRDSERMMREDQMGFLGLGMQHNPAQGVSQALGAQSVHSSAMLQQANANYAQAQQAFGQSIGAGAQFGLNLYEAMYPQGKGTKLAGTE